MKLLNIIFDNLIQSFTLIIHLRVISDREMLFDYLDLAYFLSKIEDNLRISICDNASQKVKMTFNMLKKELSKIHSYKIILNEYKQCVFDDMTYYDENAIKFLIILN